MKPPFSYFGGKTNMADRIVALLPDHSHYVEPFAGSLAVLLAKPRSELETVNDADRRLMTFWRVLREREDELIRAALLTPHGRAEMSAAYEPADDDLEEARRVWTLLSQARTGTLRQTGWRFHYSASRHYGVPDGLAAYIRRMPECARRLHGVSLECRPALDVVAGYGESPDTVLYVDPPYDASTRAASAYRIDMRAEADHRSLADALHGCKASVLLSGYPSPLYDEIYGDWARTEIKTWTGQGLRGDYDHADGDRTEVLWSNYEIEAPHQPELFGAEMAP